MTEILTIVYSGNKMTVLGICALVYMGCIGELVASRPRPPLSHLSGLHIALSRVVT